MAMNQLHSLQDVAASHSNKSKDLELQQTKEVQNKPPLVSERLNELAKPKKKIQNIEITKSFTKIAKSYAASKRIAELAQPRHSNKRAKKRNETQKKKKRTICNKKRKQNNWDDSSDSECDYKHNGYDENLNDTVESKGKYFRRPSPKRVVTPEILTHLGMLARPRVIHEAPTKVPGNVSKAALKYKASPRILRLSQPNKVQNEDEIKKEDFPKKMKKKKKKI